MIKSKELVVKSNSLVEARYKFTIWELRVFAKMVTMIKKNDKEFKKYKIDIGDLMEFFGTKSNNDYDRIREVPNSLMNKKVRIPYVDSEGKNRLFVTPLVVGTTQPNDKTIQENNNFFELSFHPDLKEHLLDLKARLLQYDIKNVLSISSVHSVRIYELLKQYEKIGKRTLEIDELKEILGIEGKYARFNNFKQRILDRAERDLRENTDICFTLKPLKRRKKVYALEFKIFKNGKSNFKKQEVVEGETAEKETNNLSQDSLFSLTEVSIADVVGEEKGEKEESLETVVLSLIEEGIAPDTAASLVKQFGEKVVEDELQYAKTTLKTTPNVKSKTGFIIRMIENQTFTEIQKYKEAQLKKTYELQRAWEQSRVLQQNRVTELRGEYTEARNLAVNAFLEGKNKAEIAELVDECAQKEPFIKKAIARAERSEDKATANDFKYLLVAKKLEDEKLRDFDAYLAQVHELKIQRDEHGESLINL